MEIMISINYPYGSINRKIVRGVTKSPRGIHYIVDVDYNYLKISESVYNECISDGIQNIETVRKGV